jgi:hypothetical protein
LFLDLAFPLHFEMGGIEDWVVEKVLEFGVKNSWNQIQEERNYRKDADAKTAETFKLMMAMPYSMHSQLLYDISHAD